MDYCVISVQPRHQTSDIVNQSAQLSWIKQWSSTSVLHLPEAWQPWHVFQARAASLHFGRLQRQRRLHNG